MVSNTWIDCTLFYTYFCTNGFQNHSPILAKFIRSKMRTWKSLIVQASPRYVLDACSSGLDLQELKKKLPIDQRGGPHLSNFFTVVPPLILGLNFFSSWRSRPLEYGSTHHEEAWTIKLFHVLSFDWIDFAKIGLCSMSLANEGPATSPHLRTHGRASRKYFWDGQFRVPKSPLLAPLLS